MTADLDTNGWPQTPRDDALKVIRKAFAVHISGDQHLPAVIQYGIDDHRDASIAFSGPAVNVSYPRWWKPETAGNNRRPGEPEHIGDFNDAFGNRLTVLAVANGTENEEELSYKHIIERLYSYSPNKKNMAAVYRRERGKSAGYGMVRFNKAQRKISMECWPFLADVTNPKEQFSGWPIVVDMLSNYAREAYGFLPEIKVTGVTDPVVSMYKDGSDELVYSLRIAGNTFRPIVFEDGVYTLKISVPEQGNRAKIEGLRPNTDELPITLTLG